MLNDSITSLKGVGEKSAEDLNRMDIYTVEDLLFHFPDRYDFFEIKPLDQLIHGDQVTVEGEVLYEPSLTFYGRKKSRLTFTLRVENVAVRAVMFNRAFAKKKIYPGDIMTLTGKWDAHRLQITVNTYKKGPAKNRATIQPVYYVKGKMTSKRFKKIMQQAIARYSNDVVELLPADYLVSYKLPTRKDAVKTMHFPNNRRSLKHARRRLIYEEFLLFQLKIQLRKQMKRTESIGIVHHYDPRIIQGFMKQLPFSLTDGQHQSLQQILADMRSPYQMNRLLQGDVGSGKTVVAAISLYAAITANKQGALMVPTEILAEQHYQSLTDLFGERVKIVLLTGSIKGKKREKILHAIENHDVDLVIGTHALIQDDVHFHDLGLVIVDEQHRFGVEQRRTLKEKGLHPDVLFMTATPIPRTLAITSFGDMDVSIIREMPKGRKKIQTYWVKENMFERVLRFIARRVAHGEQAYVITPLIEESDQLDIQNAVDLYHELTAFFPEDIRVGLMHGRLSKDEKEATMRKYAQNHLDVLVSTTVVEVGVNVPSATIMVIYDAERFGLAQLHQLRGRVGRGEKQSYCILIADPKGEVGKERMRIMSETNNGFELAEQDLQLRGPGDFFGKKQSGLPDFKVADVVHDYRALETARKDAQEMIETNMLTENPSFHNLRKHVQKDDALTAQLD
ncbi:MAG TPA: ATP-dependent DNA helicase RecG [Bacillota bacterium]|nr:ATP-dependent DNA helicase RecG [Bacillota bacterium]